MRQVHGSLYKLFKFAVAHLIQNQRQYNRRRKSKEIQTADDKRVAQHIVEFRILEQSCKMFESHPGTSQNTHMRIVIFKGHEQTAHGQIMKRKQQNQSRKPQEIYPAILIQSLA